MPSFAANDGVNLRYETWGTDTKPPLILLHGFTGSGKVFQRNVEALSNDFYVCVPDLRGHGESDKPKTGYHVARLAMDLHNFIEHKGFGNSGSAEKISAIGTSLGAAILWAYNELFTSRLFTHQIYVDQAPLQNYLSDWGPTHGNRGCNNPAALAAMQETLIADPAAAHRGTIAACLGYRSHPQPGDPTAESQTWRADEEFFLAEAMKGDGWWYGKLMADHTANDWRSSIAHSLGPGSVGEQSGTRVLVVASERSGCFPAAGPLEVVRLVNGGKEEGRASGVAVEWGGHWCYWEEPERFDQLVLEFLKSGE